MEVGAHSAFPQCLRGGEGPDDEVGGRLQEQRWGGKCSVGPTMLWSVTIPFVVFIRQQTYRVAEKGIEALPPQITNITAHNTERNERQKVTLIESDESEKKGKNKE